MRVIEFITDFGDQAIVLPVVTVILISLGIQAQWRAAYSWVVTCGFALGSVGVAKALLYACGWRLPSASASWLSVQSPSGHTVSTALIVGGICALFAGRSGWPAFRIAGAAATIAASLIAWTRLYLGAHSLAEVSIGLLVGVLATGLFVLLAGADLRRKRSPLMLIGVFAIAAALHGNRAPAEQLIRVRLAEIIQQATPYCAR